MFAPTWLGTAPIATAPMKTTLMSEPLAPVIQTAAKPLTGIEQRPLHPVQSTTGTIPTRGSVSVWSLQVPPGSAACPAATRAAIPELTGPLLMPVSLVRVSATLTVPAKPSARLFEKHAPPVHPSANPSQLPGPTPP